jgi:ankyrin repeat protein
LNGISPVQHFVPHQEQLMRTARFVFLVSLLSAVVVQTAHAQDAQSRLWDAAIAGDTAAIRKAVNDGARIDSLDTRTSRNGRRALNWAAWHNRIDAVKVLLELKAPIEAENLTGFTALHHAAESGSIDVVRILLAAGANPDHVNLAGKKPTETARELGYTEVAALLDAAVRKPSK